MPRGGDEGGGIVHGLCPSSRHSWQSSSYSAQSRIKNQESRMVLTCQAFTQSIQHNRTAPARQPCVTHAHHDSRAGAPQRYIAVSTLTSARVAPPLLPAAFPPTPACRPPLPALLPGSQHTPHRNVGKSAGRTAILVGPASFASAWPYQPDWRGSPTGAVDVWFRWRPVEGVCRT